MFDTLSLLSKRKHSHLVTKKLTNCHTEPMAFCHSTSKQDSCQCFTQTTYDGVDYNKPRGAHWKAFSACYFIPELAFSIVLGDAKYQIPILPIPGSRLRHALACLSKIKFEDVC